MEKGTAAGLGTGLLLIYGSIFMGGGWQTFFDVPSLAMVLGGTIAGLMVNFSFEELKQAGPAMKQYMSFEAEPIGDYIDIFNDLSRIARREGLLALDRKLEEIEDAFLKFGLELAVDGVDENEIQDLLQTQLNTEAKLHKFCAKLLTSSGTMAPAFGMIGTLIGLIQMMGNLSDPAQIGAGMAVALVTTFYGALFANLFFLPMAEKKKNQIQTLLYARHVVTVGVLGIVRGDSPSMLQRRLKLLMTEDDAAQEAEVA